MAQLIVRKAVSEDIPRVVRWLLNSYRTSKWAGVVCNNKYKAIYAETIRQLLARGATIDVACLDESPSLLAGFIFYEHTKRDSILHYCFVRPHLRQGGVARKLLETAGFSKGVPFVYTFRTRDARYLAHEGALHMPELARRRDAYKEPTEGSEPGPSAELRN